MTALLISSLLLIGPVVQEPVAFWLPNITANNVLGFGASADGDAAPLRAIAGDRTELAIPISLAIGPRGELYVANLRGNSVTVYPADAHGNTQPLRIIKGPSTGLEGPRGIAVGPEGTVYVSNYMVRDSSETAYSRSRVTVYAPDADGDATPIRTIWGSRTGLGEAAGIAADRTGQLYVGSYSGPHILIFGPGADGNVFPVRIIRGGIASETPSLNANALALGSDGRVYAAGFGRVVVLPAGAEEHTLAERSIQGPATGLWFSNGIAIDRRGRIAVINRGRGTSITIYDTAASGDARPVQTIAGPATSLDPSPLSQPLKPRLSITTSPQPSVLIFPPGATGDIPPDRTIAGDQTMLVKPVSMAISPDRKLYVLSCQARVTAYDLNAHGNVVPSELPTGRRLYPGGSAFGLALAGRDTVYIAARSLYPKFGAAVWVYVRGDTGIRKFLEEGWNSDGPGLARDTTGLLYRGTDLGFDVVDPYSQKRGSTAGQRTGGPDSELYGPRDIAADSHGLLYVPNADDAVRMYASGPTLGLRPRRTLAGPHTGLDDPIAVTVGPGDSLFVVNRGAARGPSITVYRPYASGDDEPVRRIGGPRTQLEAPRKVVADGAGRLYVAENPEGEIGCLPAGY